MLGVISSRRDCCASRNVGSGRSSKCYSKYMVRSIASRFFSGMELGKNILALFGGLYIDEGNRLRPHRGWI